MRVRMVAIAVAVVACGFPAAATPPATLKPAVAPPAWSTAAQSRNPALTTIRLECHGQTPGAGGCPSPRKHCRDVCYARHEVDMLNCLSGAGGILPFQREACYVQAIGRLGACNAKCVEDHPV